MSSVVSGIASGAASGAAAGSVGGFYGAVIGAVVGAIGGAFGGSKQDKAKKYLKKAAGVQREREENAIYANYLQYIRNARIKRAQTVQAASVSGLGSSSLFQGAVSSLGSQVAYSTRYTAEDYRLALEYSRYLEKAGKQSAQAQDINALTQASTALIGLASKKLQTKNTEDTDKYSFWDDKSTFDMDSLADMTEEAGIIGLSDRYI